MCNCFFLSTVITGTSYTNTSTAIIFGGRSDENILPVGVVAGIAVVATLLVVLPVGVVLGCCGLWCLLRCRSNKKKKKRANASPLYEEPVKPSGFSLTENQAYGHVTL